jgi:DNA-binding NarL/FixJ family response regulator
MAEEIKVMIVDDHEMFVQSLNRILGDTPDIDVVTTAGSIREALQGLDVWNPDVILLDHELPDGPGSRAVAMLKEKRPETKVVMLTSYTDENVLLEAVDGGCSGFITKHQAVEEVVSAVRAAADGEALIEPSMLARLLPRLRQEPEAKVELTQREREILAMLAEGLSTQAIAAKLVVSVHTVRNHIQNAMSKLGAHSKLEAVSIAVREGIIRFPNAPR